MSLLKWIKDKYQHRRATQGEHDPWWVTLMLDVGRPAVAVLILAMSAPGEHFVATLGGYSERLAWGMPGALTAYAGIAAVVATKRPKGAPGRRTAIWGAVLSIGIAMGAQPIAHLYGSGAWIVTPTARVWLMVVVSCIPAAVFGHLLHMGATIPKPVPVDTPADTTEDKQADTRDKIAKAFDVPLDMISPPVSTLSEPSEIVYTDFLSDGGHRKYGHADSGQDSPADSGQDSPADSGQDSPADTDTIVDMGQEKKAMSSTTVRSIKSAKSANVSVLVREFLIKNPDATDTDLSGHVRARKPDAKWDTIRKARDRFKENQENTG